MSHELFRRPCLGYPMNMHHTLKINLNCSKLEIIISFVLYAGCWQAKDFSLTCFGVNVDWHYKYWTSKDQFINQPCIQLFMVPLCHHRMFSKHQCPCFLYHQIIMRHYIHWVISSLPSEEISITSKSPTITWFILRMNTANYNMVCYKLLLHTAHLWQW